MMKQKEISKLLNIGQPHLSMILSGDRNITYKIAKKLKKITNIEIEFWMEASTKELKQAFKQIEKETA